MRSTPVGSARTNRRTVWAVAAALLALAIWVEGGSAAGVGRALLPARWGGSLSYGWDSNLLQSSRNEIDAFDSDDPGHLFLVDRLEGWHGVLDLWGRWDAPSFHKSLRVELAYRRSEWPHNGILGQDRFDLDLRQKLPGGSQVDLALRHEPQVYLRHRVDKDARPGEPRFRPEAYEGTEVSVGYSRPLLGLKPGVEAAYSRKEETPWFRERSERGFATTLSVEVPLSEKAKIQPLYGFERTRSRNRPDLGSDRSHREHSLGIRTDVRTAATDPLWIMRLSGKWRWREYTTDNAEDSSRYRRSDDIYSWGLWLGRAMGRWTPFLLVEGAGRIVSLPSDSDASDEDGEYRDLQVRAGIEWER